MNLYIVRHAIAVERGTPGLEDDSERPLTDDGRRRFAKCGRGLKLLGVKLDLILSSPYVRARQTAETLAMELGMPTARIGFSDALLPMSKPEELLMEINQKHQVDNLAVVGHEPHLSSLMSYLLTGGTEMPTTLKKGGVCLLQIDPMQVAPCATLEWLLTPKQLSNLA
jgi:phosphohistidine phosphatase